MSCSEAAAAQDIAEQTLCPIIVLPIDIIGSLAYMAVACFTMHHSLIVCQYLSGCHFVMLAVIAAGFMLDCWCHSCIAAA